MDTVKSFKGYGKVDESENREFQRRTRKRLLLIGISVIVLIVIVIAVSIAVVTNKKSDDNDNNGSNNIPNQSPLASIKAMCSVTSYPTTCFDSISSLKESNSTSDPEELFKLSLRVAADEIAKVSSVADKFELPTDDKRLELALKDCKELFDSAVDMLNDSVESLSKSTGEKLLTDAKIHDIRSWISAAVTNQETCLDGFEGTTGDFRTQLENAMTNSTRFTSNSLAIIAGLGGIMKDLGVSLHRKLLSESLPATIMNDKLPRWVLGSHRRSLLQAPTDVKPNVTVAKDGTGQFTTIMDAIKLVPKKNLYPFIIYIKEGVYEEQVIIEKKTWNVSIYGDGMYKTVITGSANFIDGTPTFSTATFAVVGKGFMARDMGFKNTAGPSKHQAVAFRSGSDLSVYYRCAFDAFQDTLYAHALRQFYRECDISGTVDFIFGDASVIFQKCNIRPKQPGPNQQNIITAQGKKDANENTGISIQDCTITPFSSDVTAPTYLGRPWKNFSTTIVMQSDIGAVVDPSGWLAWTWGVAPPDTINYAEFENRGPGAGVAGRVKWAGYKPAVSAEEAARFTVNSFLGDGPWLAQSGVTYQSTL